MYCSELDIFLSKNTLSPVQVKPSPGLNLDEPTHAEAAPCPPNQTWFHCHMHVPA